MRTHSAGAAANPDSGCFLPVIKHYRPLFERLGQPHLQSAVTGSGPYILAQNFERNRRFCGGLADYQRL